MTAPSETQCEKGECLIAEARGIQNGCVGGCAYAKTETPLTDQFPVSRIERALQEELHPVGMSTHSGKVTLDISHVQIIIGRSRQIETTLTESRAECERLRRDAERYRWLRDNKAYVAVHPHYRQLPLQDRTGWTIQLISGNDESFDSAIDAASAGER